jgi:hypothetical protein
MTSCTRCIETLRGAGIEPPLRDLLPERPG